MFLLKKFMLMISNLVGKLHAIGGMLFSAAIQADTLVLYIGSLLLFHVKLFLSKEEAG